MDSRAVHLELVHDPFRHRAVIGWTRDPALIRVAAEQLIAEADERAQQFDGIDDIHAEQERAEAHRLRRILRLLVPDVASDVDESGASP